MAIPENLSQIQQGSTYGELVGHIIIIIITISIDFANGNETTDVHVQYILCNVHSVVMGSWKIMKGVELYNNIVLLRGSWNLCLGYLNSLKMKEIWYFLEKL